MISTMMSITKSNKLYCKNMINIVVLVILLEILYLDVSILKLFNIFLKV